MRDKPETEFRARTFLNDLADSWEDSYVSAQVAAPEEMYDKTHTVSAVFALSDGSRTASFYITLAEKDDIEKAVASLTVIEKTLHGFIDKLKDSAKKLDELNKPALTEEIMPFGDLVEGQTLERKSKTLQSDV